jgi:hypothetical protein
MSLATIPQREYLHQSAQQREIAMQHKLRETKADGALLALERSRADQLYAEA